MDGCKILGSHSSVAEDIGSHEMWHYVTRWVVQDFGNHSSNSTASHPRRHKSLNRLLFVMKKHN